MARDYFINGESMVSVAANAVINSAYGGITQLGLSDGPITVSLDSRQRDITVDAWGNSEIPADVQTFIAQATIRMTLVHFDRDVLGICLRESMGGSASEGQLQRAGVRMGGGVARGGTGNHYIGLNILSPIGNVPWRFYSAFLTGPPVEFPLGTEKSIVTLNWRAIPYTTDPWGGGVGPLNAYLFDHTLDT